MTAKLIDGKAIAALLKTEISETIREKVASGLKPPGLAVILIGENPASEVYVRHKREACKQVGIRSIYYPFPEGIEEKKLLDLIHDLNHDENVHGILLQLPLPPTINPNTIIECIHPQKDIDGFHPYNLGRLAQRHPLLRPCTPQGVMFLLDYLQQPCKGKHAVIVGASNIVGRPMALELLIAGATITLCHRFTDDLSYYVKQADILISAVGKPGLIQGEWIKKGSIVIDIGITRLDDGRLTGDVQFDVAKEKAAWITPVPGGVGPLTVAMLLRNTLIAAGYMPIIHEDAKF